VTHSNLAEALNVKQDDGKVSKVIQFDSVKIKPHIIRVGGKEHRYGRIQVTVDESFIGEIADFQVLVRQVKKAKNV
jgi:hypothetical protein